MKRILHLPTDTGSNSWGLSRGERLLGYSSDVLVARSSKRGYPADISLGLEEINSRYLRYLKQLLAFIKVRNKYDIFHFNYGSSLLHAPSVSFLNQFDLPFYPRKSKLFVTYNGCDARQKYPTMKRTATAACHNPDCYDGMCNSGALDRMRRAGIAKMARYVQHMWALNPDLLYFLPEEKSSFMPYTVCNFDVEPSLPRLQQKLKIIHAPTNQASKGSAYILAAMDKLMQKYPGLIEPVIIRNLPHEQALRMYREADLIIDQCVIGWYGAFAVETMLMGKPVVARIALEDLKFIPQEMAHDVQEAIINVSPETVYHVLERYLHDRSLLKYHAEGCLEYARKWHNPLYVANLAKVQYES